MIDSKQSEYIEKFIMVIKDRDVTTKQLSLEFGITTNLVNRIIDMATLRENSKLYKYYKPTKAGHVICFSWNDRDIGACCGL